jgi:stage II sporulation protein M
MPYKYWVFIAAGLFVIGLGIGVVISATMPADIVSLFSGQLANLEKLASILGPFQATTAILIFFKNVSALLFSFIFSPILCLMPVIALVLNGSLISFVSAMVVQEESIALVLAGLLPHGIFEIPAFIIGEAAALSMGTATIIALFAKDRRSQLISTLKTNLKYLVLAFILLVPAAIIETFITPLFLQ